MAGETEVAETPAVPGSPRTPTCPTCGFAVAVKGETCAVCKDKADAAPKGRWELGPQPVPPYMKDGHAPREEEDDEGDED